MQAAGSLSIDRPVVSAATIEEIFPKSRPEDERRESGTARVAL